jgi:hypothetical protein
VVVAVKRAALRGLANGLALAGFFLAMPLAWRLGTAIGNLIGSPVLNMHFR